MLAMNRNRPDSLAANPRGRDLSLVQASQGQELEFVRVQGGHRLAARLATMGLISGIRFKVESGGRTGPFLIIVGGARFILGHGMAEQMIVRRVGDRQR